MRPRLLLDSRMRESINSGLTGYSPEVWTAVRVVRLMTTGLLLMML